MKGRVLSTKRNKKEPALYTVASPRNRNSSSPGNDVLVVPRLLFPQKPDFFLEKDKKEA